MASALPAAAHRQEVLASGLRRGPDPEAFLYRLGKLGRVPQVRSSENSGSLLWELLLQEGSNNLPGDAWGGLPGAVPSARPEKPRSCQRSRSRQTRLPGYARYKRRSICPTVVPRWERRSTPGRAETHLRLEVGILLGLSQPVVVLSWFQPYEACWWHLAIISWKYLSPQTLCRA